MVLLEQHEEWQVGRRYLSEISMRSLLTAAAEPISTPELKAA